MYRPFAIIVLLGLGTFAPREEGPVLVVDSPVPEMRIRPGVAVAVGLPFALITLLLTALVVRARRSSVVTGREGMIGQIGLAAGPLSPRGKVFAHGEYWDAVSVTSVSDGVPVKVTGLEQLTLLVQPVSNQPGG